MQRDCCFVQVYEQDWTGHSQYYNLWLFQEAGGAARWFAEMGRAAARHGVRVGYGTIAGGADVLAAALAAPPGVAAFFFASANPNFMWARDENWRISHTAGLLAAFGLAPMKDCLWTSSVEPGP